MALNLFTRIETRKGLFAVEKVSLAYSLLTSLFILCLFHKLDHPLQMLLDRVLIAGMTFLLMYLYRLAPCKFSAYVRVAIQMALLSYWYPDTFEFNSIFPNLDHVFAGAEQWIFGGQPAVWFSLHFPQIWISEPLNLGYFCYYPMIFVLVTWYFLLRFERLEEMAFVIVTSFFIYYLIFIFVPVAGPQFYFPAIGEENVAAGVFPPIGNYFHLHQELLPAPGYEHGFFYNLVEDTQRVGERPTGAFPSSHVGVATILMVLAWRGSRRLFGCMFPFYILLCLATVYIQAHYLIDAIVGFLTSFLFYFLTSRVFKHWFRPLYTKPACPL